MRIAATSRISRRLGERLFLKAERDASQKSAMVRRPYPPGQHGKRRSRGLSDFGQALSEKQKVRFLYGLTNAAMRRAVKRAADAVRQSRTARLVEILELRLDNVVYRLGFAPSRRIARQLVSHGHILVNGARVRTPSRELRPNDTVAIREQSRKHPLFAELPARIAKHEIPAWLTRNLETLTGTITRPPTEEDAMITQRLTKIIEFYSH